MRIKCVFILFLCCLLSANTSAYSAAARYGPPYEHITGDWLDQNMPTPFSVEGVPKTLLAEEGFSGGATGGQLSPLFTLMEGWSYDGDALRVDTATNDTAKQATFFFTGDIRAGDYYAFTCTIKGETLNGSPRNILAAYRNDAGRKWMAEAGNHLGRGGTDTDGKYEMFQVLQAPSGANELHLSLQMDKGVTGTVYFDDLKLYRIALDPLKTVLSKPAYKGLLYGDGIADIDLDILITETLGFFELEGMRLSVQLLDSENRVIKSSETALPQRRMNMVFSSAGLDEGTYYLQTRLLSTTGGGLISQNEHVLRKARADYRPDFYIDENGHALRDGQKIFLKRIYNSTNNFEKLIPDVVQSPIASICHNGMRWWYLADDTDTDALIQTLRTSGKRIILSLVGYWWGNRPLDVNMSKSLFQQQRDIRSFISNVVRDHKDDAVLDGYYIFDEPNPILYGDEIRWNHDILSDLDLNNPVYGITDKQFDNYGLFTGMADVLGIDPYPVSGDPTDDFARVGRNMRDMTASFPNRPVYLCLQGFNWTEMYGGDSRGPNYQELRNMAYQAICEGAEGLDCYSYHEMWEDPRKSFEDWWSEFCALYSDVEKYENIILSDEPKPTYKLSGSGDWINITARRYNGKSYLFAVNNTMAHQAASVQMSGASAMENLDTAERLSPDASNNYSLSFSPLEVKILEITQEAYLSSEAELIGMGFFNCNKIFPVAEGDESILQVTDDSLVLNYHAQISNDAAFYINGVERPLKGKLSIRHAESFTVSVVSENGMVKNEKLYRIMQIDSTN